MAGSSHIHSSQANEAANAGANEEHGDKEARGDGTPSRPCSAPKVEDQHHQKRCISELPMRPAREQMPDCILPCAHASSIAALTGFACEPNWLSGTLMGFQVTRPRSCTGLETVTLFSNSPMPLANMRGQVVWSLDHGLLLTLESNLIQRVISGSPKEGPLPPLHVADP